MMPRPFVAVNGQWTGGMPVVLNRPVHRLYRGDLGAIHEADVFGQRSAGDFGARMRTASVAQQPSRT